jgi:hypothetical protein
MRDVFPNSGSRIPGLWLFSVCGVLLLTISGCSGSIFAPQRDQLEIDHNLSRPKEKILFADNTIYQNNRSGIQIRGNTPVLVSNCNVYRNGRAGINVEDSADVAVEGSSFFQNGTSGVVGNNASRIIVRDSRIHQNQRAGMRIRKSERPALNATLVSLVNNKIFLNGRGGLHAISSALTPIKILASENSIYRNSEAGIRIEDNVYLAATRNKIYRNKTSGISSYITLDVSPKLDVYQNKIYFNRGPGIFIHSGSTGSIGISNNWIYNNYLAGIACGLWDGPEKEKIDVEIFHNTIVGNGSNNLGTGVRNYSSGSVAIKDNIISYNFTSGILTDNCWGGSHNLLFANAETSRAEGDSKRQSIFIEREQYAGCSGKQWGDILADPLFVNPDQYDFSLQPDSPARDAASTIHSPYFDELPNSDLGAAPSLLPDS